MAKTNPTKKPPNTAAALHSAEAERKILVVDELGQLEAELAAVKLKAKLAEILKHEVQGWANEYPPEMPVMFEGRRYCAQVSARGNRRRIADMVKLFAVLGRDKFLKVCSFTLKAAEEQLAPQELSQVIVEDQYVGERTVKSMQRANPIAIQPAA